MTLQDFFNWVKVNPYYTLAYFILIPVIALLAGIFAKNEGHQSPWKYVYTTLIYLVCIPGIFAVTFNIYLFFWERSKKLGNLGIVSSRCVIIIAAMFK